MPRRLTRWLPCVFVLLLAALTGGTTASLAHASVTDGRVYEQVSPVDKNAADVLPNETRVRASDAGDRAIFASLTGFGDAQGIAVSSEYIAASEAGGRWASHGISAPQDATGYFPTLGALEPVYVAVSDDLTQGVLRTRSALTLAPNVEGSFNLYARNNLIESGAGAYMLLTDSVTAQPPSVSEEFLVPNVVGTSTDFSHILIQSYRSLTSDAPTCNQPSPQENCPLLLYEWANGELRIAGVLPSAEGGGVAAASRVGRGAPHGMSADGSRVMFTVPTVNSELRGALYLRDDHGTADIADDTTIKVNASERTTPDADGPKPATFWGASSDMTAVFLTTAEQLTDDDVNSTDDVYRFLPDAPLGERLTRISVDSEPLDGVDSSCGGVMGVANDGSYVYFICTNAQLVQGGPIGETGGPQGGARIFLWHESGPTQSVREVAGVNGGLEIDSLLGVGARMTPSGKHLAFLTEGTQELLTLYGHPSEYDHGAGAGCQFLHPECNEVYVYDATANGSAGDLRCASCNPTGAAATTDAGFEGNGVGLGAAADTNYVNRALSEDGRFVFFNSEERLDPDDRNDALDAYEYDTTSQQVHLISSGTGTDPATFLDASASGHDVFFTTRERLRSTDRDQSRDLYDARVGGTPDPGLPSIAVCEGDSCRPPASQLGGDAPFPSEVADGPDDELVPPGPFAFVSTETLTQRARKGLARRGQARITIHVSDAGTVGVRLAAQIGRKMRPIQSTSRTLKRGATIKVQIRLNAAARKWLARHRRLKLQIATSYSQSATVQIRHVLLRR